MYSKRSLTLLDTLFLNMRFVMRIKIKGMHGNMRLCHTGGLKNAFSEVESKNDL